MPFFSIYEPLSGPLHYFTVTLIGFQQDVLVRWSPGPEGWMPQVIHFSELAVYRNTKLEGYVLTHPDEIDTTALEAMTGQRRSWP